MTKDAAFQRHPWEVSRAQFFSQCLAEAFQDRQPKNLLDVGGGDGFLAHTLAQSFAQLSVVCWDIHYDEASIEQLTAQYPTLSFASECPEKRYDGLLLLDVLEHVEDDAAFLRELVSHSLLEGGLALISVPAWPILFSSHDKYLKHFRRYTPQTARHLVENSGLRILQSGGLFHSLLLPKTMSLLREKLWGPKPFSGLSQWRAGPWVTRLVQAGLSCDNWLTKEMGARGLSLPGLSWWALCEKNHGPSRLE